MLEASTSSGEPPYLDGLRASEDVVPADRSDDASLPLPLELETDDEAGGLSALHRRPS